LAEREGSPEGDGAVLRPAAFRHSIGQAREALGAGRLDEAENRVRAVLSDRPEHPDALHLLGVIALHRGHERPAAELLGRAVAIDPHHAAIHSDLGNAIEIELGNPVFHNNLGNTLQELQRLDDAAQALEPRYGDAHYNLGLVHEARDDFEAAIAFDIYPEAWPMG
jgi:tetratricopeptide (TPR) repeat protein